MRQVFKHFSIEERECIQKYIWLRWSIRKIAKELGRSPSSVSREIKKNNPESRKRYTPRLAHIRAKEVNKTRGKRDRLRDNTIKAYVLEKLKLRWSPEQISGRLLRDKKLHISHEAIYQFIYAQYYRGGNGKCIGLNLVKYLRHKHKRRSRKYVPCQDIPLYQKDKVYIHDRPAYIKRRKQFGHWETDSMVSRQSNICLNTSVERVSGYVRIQILKDHTSTETTKAIMSYFSQIPAAIRKSITSDNGFEFRGHKDISQLFERGYFFCHPYSSHERGTNENTNGLIRDFFPKKTDFGTLTEEQIQKAEYLLNTRPRKRLKYRTPLEVLGVAFTC
jgi:IS30 family transposase